MNENFTPVIFLLSDTSHFKQYFGKHNRWAGVLFDDSLTLHFPMRKLQELSYIHISSDTNKDLNLVVQFNISFRTYNILIDRKYYCDDFHCYI